jgi:predicted nucleotidyltransferase
MSLSPKASSEIGKLIVTTIREKLRNYNPETKHMPFHHRLLGKDRYAMFSFIHSMNTTFGMSIFEPVAVILAKSAGNYAEKQHKLLGNIDNETEETIRKIHHQLRKGNIDADKVGEIEQVRKTIKVGKPETDPDSTVDLFVKIRSEESYFDIVSAKPNMKEFVALKLKLLRWTALRLSQDKNVEVFTRLAVPYNPYHPEPYERWTLKGLYDLEKGEVLVGDEFWNFLAGAYIYEDLLNVFQKAGKELRDEINEKFEKLRGN